jgi:hypothetical protein
MQCPFSEIDRAQSTACHGAGQSVWTLLSCLLLQMYRPGRLQVALSKHGSMLHTAALVHCAIHHQHRLTPSPCACFADGSQFMMDGSGTGSIPEQYRAEVQQQLETLQKLTAMALGGKLI